VTILRVSTDERITVRLFDRRGRVPAETRTQIDRIFRHTQTGRQRRIDSDLLHLLQRVADHWPGQAIRVHSGYRPYRRSQYTRHSKHNTGHAMDFTVEGVSNADLRTFCRTLPDAGVGYYPNSRFVHMDSRDERAYWVDWSGPGEVPRYGREDGGDPRRPRRRDRRIRRRPRIARPRRGRRRRSRRRRRRGASRRGRSPSRRRR